MRVEGLLGAKEGGSTGCSEATAVILTAIATLAVLKDQVVVACVVPGAHAGGGSVLTAVGMWAATFTTSIAALAEETAFCAG